MSADVAVVAPAARVPREHHTGPDVAITRRAFKQLWIGATICALTFGGTIASSALAYVSTFPTVASRQEIAAATSADAGFAILLGPTSAMETVGGYTVYKCYVTLTTIGAIWALLAATRLLRGEEDAGRWQLVLAGSTRPARATLATLAALGGALAIVFVGTTVLTMLAGRSPDVGFGAGETVLYGASLMIAPAVFAAVGAFTSQLSRTRRTATALAIGVFAISFVLRMIADSGPSTHWLRWVTPFGWTELMAPFTQNNAWPLLPAVLTVAVLASATTVLAGRRDAGDGLLATNDVSRPRSFGLRSPVRLAARLELPSLIAWCAGAVATGLCLGIIATVTKAKIPESMGGALEKFGVQGSFAYQYLSIAFLMVATVVALVPAGQLGAAAEEEQSGRLAHLLSQPVHRTAWFVGRLALTAGVVVVASVLAGFATWVGAASQGIDVALAPMLGAGLNVIPSALVALGVGAVVLAVTPRAAAASVYLLVAWSLVVDILGSMFTDMGWLEQLTLFHSMALAPAADPQPKTLAITVLIALALCTLATVLFRRRDLRSA